MKRVLIGALLVLLPGWPASAKKSVRKHGALAKAGSQSAPGLGGNGTTTSSSPGLGANADAKSGAPAH